MPAASKAFVWSAWLPFAAVVVFHAISYGEDVSVPSSDAVHVELHAADADVVARVGRDRDGAAHGRAARGRGDGRRGRRRVSATAAAEERVQQPVRRAGARVRDLVRRGVVDQRLTSPSPARRSGSSGGRARGAGHVRRRHRRAADRVGRGVARVPGRGDARARREDVDAGAEVGERGARVGAGRRADGVAPGDAGRRVVAGVRRWSCPRRSRS